MYMQAAIAKGASRCISLAFLEARRAVCVPRLDASFTAANHTQKRTGHAHVRAQSTGTGALSEQKRARTRVVAQSHSFLSSAGQM